MSGIFWKNIHLCVPKFKCLPTNLSPPPVNDDHENAKQINDNAAAALIKNFNSIYDTSVNSASTGSKSVPFSSTEEFNRFSISSSDDDEYSDHDDCYSTLEYFSGNPPDFSSVFASRRFFFSSPGKSNSIIDYYSPKEKISPLSPPPLPPPPPPPPPLSPLPPPAAAVENGIVAVQIQTYSPDPYADFRRSMQEMVEAHELIKDLKADWNYLHELLLCYLSLNPKSTHKLIIGAFTDLIVSLTSTTSSSNNSGHRKTDGVNDNQRCTTTSTHNLLP